jgi:hypothetical protein
MILEAQEAVIEKLRRELEREKKTMNTTHLAIIMQLLNAELTDAIKAVDTAQKQLDSVAGLAERIQNRLRTYHA